MVLLVVGSSTCPGEEESDCTLLMCCTLLEQVYCAIHTRYQTVSFYAMCSMPSMLLLAKNAHAISLQKARAVHSTVGSHYGHVSAWNLSLSANYCYSSPFSSYANICILSLTINGTTAPPFLILCILVLQ